MSNSSRQFHAACDVVDVLMGEGWVRGRELRRQLNAAGCRRTPLGFYRLLRRLVRWGVVEARLEAVAAGEAKEEGLAFRAAMVETAEGAVPRLRWEMEKVYREMYEERTARLARAHLRRHVHGTDPKP